KVPRANQRTMRTKPQRLCRKNRVTRIHEKRRIETCCRDADSQGQAVNAKKYHRDSIIFRGQAAFCSFSRAQSATDEALVDAFVSPVQRPRTRMPRPA